MKTLSLEASKILQQYMPNKTEYYHIQTLDDKWDVLHGSSETPSIIEHKTLTLEEAIDMLPGKLETNMGFIYEYKITKRKGKYILEYECEGKYPMYDTMIGESLLQAVEKMLLYLHDNGLLTK